MASRGHLGIALLSSGARLRLGLSRCVVAYEAGGAVLMSALPSIHYCQKGALSDDAHPCPGRSIRAVPPARRRVSPSAILLPANRGTRHPIRSLDGSRRLRLHAFAHQLPVKLIAAALIHHRCRLSSSVCPVSIDANVKDLTHGAQPLPSRGKAYD